MWFDPADFDDSGGAEGDDDNGGEGDGHDDNDQDSLDVTSEGRAVEAYVDREEKESFP